MYSFIVDLLNVQNTVSGSNFACKPIENKLFVKCENNLGGPFS